MSYLIYGLIFLPMAGALLSYMLGRKYKKYRDYFVSGLAVLEFVLAAVLLFQYVAGAEKTYMTRLSDI